MKYNKAFLVAHILIAFFLISCGGSPLISTPVENIDASPLKVLELTNAEKENWGHLDLEKDTIPGMGVDRAYAEILKGKKGKKVIVAIIDSGIDINHEDLDGVIWTNKNEIPYNGKDDDNNGYVDDVHGWNFLGDTYNEQLEMTRLVASGDTSSQRFAEAKADVEKSYNEALQTKKNIDALLQRIPPAQETLKKHLEKNDYTKDDVRKINPDTEDLGQAKGLQMFLYNNNLTLNQIKEIGESYNDQLNL